MTEQKQNADGYKSVATSIRRIRRSRDFRAFETSNEVARIVVKNLRQRGKFYFEGEEAYLFFKDEKRLMRIHKDDTEFTLMLSRCDINRSEPIYRYVFEDLYAEALRKGTKTEIHRLAYYDPVTFTLYLSSFNNQIYRISPEDIELEDNGTDGVLFLHSHRDQPFVVDMEAKETSSSLLEGVLFSKINFAEDILSADEQRQLIRPWFYSLFFESIFPTKPILALLGEKGSGKSCALRKVGKMFFGESFDVTPVPTKPEDFDVAASNTAFLVIDNADSKIRWLNDKLATLATGGTIKKRALYTDNRMIEVRPRCFLAINARTPEFNREDVADRLLILRLVRPKIFVSESKLLNEVLENRNQLMSEVVVQLQKVVRALKAEKSNDYSGSFRMADFADFAVKVSKHMEDGTKMEDIFDKLTRSQTEFTLEGDPVYELLCIWIDEHEGCNEGREIRNPELCDELSNLAVGRYMNFPYRDNPRGFGQKMSQLRPMLKEFFEIQERPIGGNRKAYSYRKKETI